MYSLHNHTEYSNASRGFADSSIKLNDIVKKAKEYAEEQLNRKDKLTSAINEHDLQKAVLELKVFEHRKIKNKSKGVKY